MTVTENSPVLCRAQERCQKNGILQLFAAKLSNVVRCAFFIAKNRGHCRAQRIPSRPIQTGYRSNENVDVPEKSDQSTTPSMMTCICNWPIKSLESKHRHRCEQPLFQSFCECPMPKYRVCHEFRPICFYYIF